VAEADIECGLAEATVFIALTLTFGHFALRATVFRLAGSGGHEYRVALGGSDGNVPLVTARTVLPLPPTFEKGLLSFARMDSRGRMSPQGHSQITVPTYLFPYNSS
jgi:hypothetical protein